MTDITVTKLDESYLRISCTEPSTDKELNEFFTFFAPKHQFHPLFRRKKWDGKVRLYSTVTNKLPHGLLRYLLEFAKERNYTVDASGVEVLNNFSLEEADQFLKKLNLPFEPHAHQVVGFAKAIRYKRIVLESATNSGKSLIIYALARYLLSHGSKRGILVVPNVALVEQMYKDFENYEGNTWTLDHCQKLYEGQDKDISDDTGLLITTWQSIYQNKPEWFKQFDFVVGDEAHNFKADSLKYVMSHLVDCAYRVGTTGTLDDWKMHRLVIEGHFGPASKVATNLEMQQKGISAPIKIKGLVLKHSEVVSEEMRKVAAQYKAAKQHQKVWKTEMDYLVQNKKRNLFIRNLALSLKGNTLVLFQFLKHGELLDLLIGNGGKRQVFLVNGKTEVEEREMVRELAEKHDDVVILASYGVYSTGVNVKNLHHLVFASPTKSKIRVLQSIGRGLRINDGKSHITLYDITDDMRSKKWINTTLKHYVDRLKIYKKEGWTVSSYVIEL